MAEWLDTNLVLDNGFTSTVTLHPAVPIPIFHTPSELERHPSPLAAAAS